MTACVQPASTASRNFFWMKKRPGIVILRILRSFLSATLNRRVPRSAVTAPCASRMPFMISAVLVFPLVPVMRMTVRCFAGKRYRIAPAHASKKW